MSYRGRHHRACLRFEHGVGDARRDIDPGRNIGFGQSESDDRCAAAPDAFDDRGVRAFAAHVPLCVLPQRPRHVRVMVPEHRLGDRVGTPVRVVRQVCGDSPGGSSSECCNGVCLGMLRCGYVSLPDDLGMNHRRRTVWHPRRLRQARRGGILSGMSGGICGHPTASGPPCTQPLPEGRTWCGQCKGPVGSGSHGADRNAARDAAAAAESALAAQPANSPASDLKIASDIPSAGRQRDPTFAYCYFSRGDTDFDIGPLHDGRVLVETEQSGGYYGAAQVRFSFDEREAAILVTEFAQRFGWTGTSGNEAAAHVENDGLGADDHQAETTERRASIGLRQSSAARAALSETGRQLLDAEAAGVNTTEEHAAFDKLLAEHEEALQAMRDGAPTFAATKPFASG